MPNHYMELWNLIGGERERVTYSEIDSHIYIKRNRDRVPYIMQKLTYLKKNIHLKSIKLDRWIDR